MPSPLNAQRLPLLIFAACLLAILAALFGPALSRPAPARTAAAKPVVAATIFPLYDIVRHVAGGAVDVKLILPPNAEPHTYEPPPTLVAELAGTRTVFAIGHGLDDWIDPVTAAAGTTKTVVDGGIDLLPAENPISDEAGSAEAAGPADPHYWLSLPNAKKIALNVAAVLKADVPAEAPAIDAYLAAYLRELDAADARVRGILTGVRSRDIIVFHEAWYYFAKEYGLRVAGNFEPTAGREPTPRYLTALKDAVVRSGARVIYTEPLFDPGLIRSFADDNRLTLAALDDIGGVPGRDSLIALVIYDAQTIKDNQ